MFAAASSFFAGVFGGLLTIPITDSIKWVLFLLSKALFAVYRSLRDVLVVQAYATPYTDEITGMLGPLDVQTLWRSLGNAGPPIIFPHEELLAERQKFASSYNPAAPLATPPERPTLAIAAPYLARPSPAGGPIVPTLPDAFIDAPLGPHNMFLKTSPRFGAGVRNFGGALANSRKGIDLAPEEHFR